MRAKGRPFSDNQVGSSSRRGHVPRTSNWWRGSMIHKRGYDIVGSVALSILALLQLAPLAIVLLMSGKTQSQFATKPLLLTLPFHFSNYLEAWLGIRGFMFNSLTISVTTLLGDMLLSATAAYVFARYSFPLKNLLFNLLLALLMIPGITTLFPRYILIRDLGLLGSLWGVIIPGVFGVIPFNVVVFRMYFESLPEEIFEAARLDGAGHVAVFSMIVVPLSWAITSSLAILGVLGTWNDYIWPLLVLNRDDLLTVSVGLVFLSTTRNLRIGVVMAGNVLASLPLLVLFIFAMRTFIRGLTSGALKL